MSLLALGTWVTDFMGYPDVVQEEERKDRLLGFIRYGLKQNPGVIALTVSILGVNHFQALAVFCNVQTNFTEKSRRKQNCVDFDRDRFYQILKERKIRYKDIANEIGVSTQVINNIIYKGAYCRKDKKFVDKVEKFLGLPQGSLILKGENHEESISFRL